MPPVEIYEPEKSVFAASASRGASSGVARTATTAVTVGVGPSSQQSWLFLRKKAAVWVVSGFSIRRLVVPYAMNFRDRVSFKC